MASKNQKEFFSYLAIATKYGISTDRITKWVADGDLTAINLNATEPHKRPAYRVKMSDVIDLLSGKNVKPALKQKKRVGKKRKVKHTFG